MFKDKVVIITGASTGIGEAIARAFDPLGATTVLVSRSKDKLDRIASSLKNAHVFVSDLSDPANARDMISEVYNRFGKINILINNAASIIVSPAELVSPDDLMYAFRTNLISPAVATQEALKIMKQQGSGHIINIGSPGFMMGIPFYAPYVCSKAAFSAWTRTIQAEWADSGIHISEYFPGYIKTDSRPDSRIGEVEQDFLMSKSQNFLTRKFAKPKTAEDVAKHIIKLVRRPQTLRYSGFGVKLGAFISNIPGFRLNLAKQMAITARSKTNIKI